MTCPVLVLLCWKTSSQFMRRLGHSGHKVPMEFIPRSMRILTVPKGADLI
jgi:hypothetical protein